MLAYFDTSAVVPLLVREPSSELCRRIFQGANAVLTSRLTYVAVGAALAMASRMARISETGRDRAWAAFQGLWPTVDVVAVTPALARSAADMAVEHRLRGYDAVHCASGAIAPVSGGVSVSGNATLLRAWTSLGLSTVDTSAQTA